MNPGALVLYAEDDENDAFFMERAFGKLDCRAALRIVASGRQAIDYLRGRGEFADRRRFPPPTIVFLDVKMPEMSGLEVLQWVRAQPAYASLPILMLTSSTQESDVAFCRRHGANAYIAKPANAEQLASLVADVLGAVSSPERLLAIKANRLRPEPM